jgi:hypothetical protein
MFWYGRCFSLWQEELAMKKTHALIAIGLLATSVTIPISRGYADDDPPGNQDQREELREDLRDLQRLRRQRDRELREGDIGEAREYNEKIRRQEREVRRDRREIYRSDGDRNRDRDWWDRIWGRN